MSINSVCSLQFFQFYKREDVLEECAMRLALDSCWNVVNRLWLAQVGCYITIHLLFSPVFSYEFIFPDEPGWVCQLPRGVISA